MGIKDLLSGMMAKQDPGEEVPDDLTTDKFLRSLRRQRRLQIEEGEKVRLKAQIASFEKNRTRKELFGISDTKNTTNLLKGGRKFGRVKSPAAKVTFKKRKGKKFGLGKMF